MSFYHILALVHQKKLRFYEGEVCYIARLETVDCE